MKLDRSICTHVYEHAIGRDKDGREYPYCNTCGAELRFLNTDSHSTPGWCDSCGDSLEGEIGKRCFICLTSIGPDNDSQVEK